MTDFINKFIDSFLIGRTRAGGIYEAWLPWIEFFSFIISLGLIIAIIILAIKSQWFLSRVDEFVDTWKFGNISRRRNIRAWKEILKKLQKEDPNEWKKAVIEADKILGELLRLSGYTGRSVHERLAQIPPGSLKNIEHIREAHRVRDGMFLDKDYELVHEDALRFIEAYKEAFQEFGLID